MTYTRSQQRGLTKKQQRTYKAHFILDGAFLLEKFQYCIEAYIFDKRKFSEATLKSHRFDELFIERDLMRTGFNLCLYWIYVLFEFIEFNASK